MIVILLSSMWKKKVVKILLAQRRDTCVSIQVTKKSRGSYGFKNNCIWGSVMSEDLILLPPVHGTVSLMAKWKTHSAFSLDPGGQWLSWTEELCVYSDSFAWSHAHAQMHCYYRLGLLKRVLTMIKSEPCGILLVLGWEYEDYVFSLRKVILLAEDREGTAMCLNNRHLGF